MVIIMRTNSGIDPPTDLNRWVTCGCSRTRVAISICIGHRLNYAREFLQGRGEHTEYWSVADSKAGDEIYKGKHTHKAA